ncbi:MAG: hypothetical protein J1E03_04370 [Acetatifactor sp.]|nr:hypothetical protein [Acetatifactor sp.]
MEINKQHIYGYASIRTGHTKEDLVTSLQKRKIYNQFENLMFAVPKNDEVEQDSNFIENNMIFKEDDTIQIDVMTSARKGMYYKLDCIIEQAKRESKKPFNTIIVITSLNAFGNCENIKRYYKIFRKEKIGILYPDYTRESDLSEYSTCDFGFKPRSQSEYDRAFDLVERLVDGDIKDNRGRISDGYSIAFRTAFWLYELFKVPEKVAVAMSGYSKNGFHMKADSYEQTANYKKELETFEKNFEISKLIKRNRPVPESFDKLMHWYEKKRNLELACIHCKVPMIFPVDYKRLILKNEGGKKELARCLKLYDEDLINRFEEWVKEGNKPTEFYLYCSMEQYLSS